LRTTLNTAHDWPQCRKGFPLGFPACASRAPLFLAAVLGKGLEVVERELGVAKGKR